jgi:hypothetical protein
MISFSDDIVSAEESMGGTSLLWCSGCQSYQIPALRPNFALYQTKGGRGRNAQLVNFDILLPCKLYLRKRQNKSAML